MVTSFGKTPKDVKRSDGDGWEGAGGAFSATPVPSLPSELAAADKRSLSFGKRAKDVGESGVSFGKMPKDVEVGGEREVEVERNRWVERRRGRRTGEVEEEESGKKGGENGGKNGWTESETEKNDYI